MNTNTLRTVLFIASCLLIAGCKQKEVVFTYTPETPRAGQSITFTNGTSEGEKWDWNFGDGTSSASKNPSKVYKKPGSYTVVLKVDGKNNLTYSKTINVIDTVPCIQLANDSIVRVFQPVTLRMSAYNPYSHDLTYQWQLNDSVELLEGELTDATIKVLFKHCNTTATIRGLLTLGQNGYYCEQDFIVNDTATHSLLMASNGSFQRQRTFSYGAEEPTAFDPATVTDPNLYAFTHGLVGCTYHGVTYSVDSIGNIYRANAPWTNVTQLGYGLSLGTKATGFAWYNNVAFLAYGNGIYRFTEADINAGKTPEAGAILTDVAVKRFAIDSVGAKIYYLTGDGLHICNISGTNAKRISDNADGNALCVDNAFSRIYWTRTDGVWFLPLIQAPNNASTAVPEKLNDATQLSDLSIDANPVLHL